MAFARKLVLALVIGGAAACEGRIVTTSPTGGGTDDDGTGGDAVALDDGEAAHVAFTANLGEVQQATAALPFLFRRDVRDYAERMIDEHTEANDRLLDVVQQAELELVDNEVSDDLETTSASVIRNLQQSGFGAADDIYVDAQVDVHQTVLTLIEDELLPAADDDALAAFLEDMRDDVEAHLELALELQGGDGPVAGDEGAGDEGTGDDGAGDDGASE